jgi:hypothetical protein
MLFFYSSCLNFAATVLQSPEITLWFFEKIEKVIKAWCPKLLLNQLDLLLSLLKMVLSSEEATMFAQAKKSGNNHYLPDRRTSWLESGRHRAATRIGTYSGLACP